MTSRGRLHLRLTSSSLWLLALLLVAGCGGGGNTNSKNSAASCSQARAVTLNEENLLCLGNEAVGVLRSALNSRIVSQSLMQPAGGFDPRFYPAEVLASVMALAEDTGDAPMLSWADAELAKLAVQTEAENGFLIWPIQIDGQPTFGSNSQARLVLSLALIQGQRPSPLVLRLGRSALAALERLPRRSVTSSVSGRSYLLPAYSFHNPQAPIAISGRSVDPNQDAALALAYALAAVHLSDTPLDRAVYFGRAQEYFAASQDLANSESCLPLADEPDFVAACDTRYNGFWLMLSVASAQLMGYTDGWIKLESQYRHLLPWWSTGSTSRVYPVKYSGRYTDPIELMLLRTAVARFGTDTMWDAYLLQLEAFILDEHLGAGSWPAGWLYPRYLMTAAR
jgi:hypothetical protein